MKKNNLCTTVNQCFKTATLLGLFLTTSSASAFEPTCINTTSMPLNTSFRSDEQIPGSSRFFELEVPAAGLVTLDVATPLTDEIEAKLGFFGRGCSEPSPFSNELDVIEQAPSRLAWIADAPGTYVFAVAAQDPRNPLGRYKLTAGFVAVEALDRQSFDRRREKDGEDDDELELEPDLKDGEDDDELELEPDLKAASRFEKDGEDDDELELEPDLKDGEDDDELELEPDAKTVLPGDLWFLDNAPLSPAWHLCRQLEIDDHGDTFACATRLQPGSEVTGEISNAWGDDQDLFRFALTETRTVGIAVAGPADTFLSLHDRHGHLLAADDDGGRHASSRIVKTLSAGLYFVRVEGSHAAEGPYSLRVASRPW